MSRNRIRFDGLDELRAQLRRLPDDLAAEASTIVVRAGEDAEREIDAAYQRHQRSGSLRSGLDLVRSAAGRFGVGVLLINRAHHAWLFEHGSQARYDRGMPRGTMPATPTFVPIVIRKRRAMYEALKGVLRRAGLVVFGDAA